MQGLEDHCFRFTRDELFNGLPAQLVDEWYFIFHIFYIFHICIFNSFKEGFPSTS